MSESRVKTTRACSTEEGREGGREGEDQKDRRYQEPRIEGGREEGRKGGREGMDRRRRKRGTRWRDNQ